MTTYSNQHKEFILSKMKPPFNLSIPEINKEFGIPLTTLYNWRDKALKKELKMAPSADRKEVTWKEKLLAVAACQAKNSAEISQYCRNNGFYPEDIKRWENEFKSIERLNEPAKLTKEEKRAQAADRKKIKQLEKELNRKDKALAETTALLVLQKKWNAIWEDDKED